MELEEKILCSKRKNNMKLYSIHRTLTADLLFYYAIEFIFLTQVKKISASDVIFANAIWGILQFIFQAPTTVLINKIGNKKSIILSDLIAALGVFILMFCNSLVILIISYSMSAIAFSIRGVAESAILNRSIPSKEAKSNIFADIEARGLKKYYYLSAISSVISGLLYNINPYIPLSICIIILLISAYVATKFKNIKIKKDNTVKELPQECATYFKQLNTDSTVIFKSKKIMILMIYAAIMSGIILVMNNYEKGFLQDINVSTVNIGIIYAAMQIIAGIASSKHRKFNETYRNKTFTLIGISYTLSCIIAGIISIINIPYIATISIVILTYIIRYIGYGLFFVLIKKYITSFTNANMANKMYSTYGIMTGLGDAIVGIIGSYITLKNNLQYSMIIFGLISMAMILITLKFMRKESYYKSKKIEKTA